jgi:hypothetical protein
MAHSARLYEPPEEPVKVAWVPQANLVPVRPDVVEPAEVPVQATPEADHRWPAIVRFATIFGAAAACWAIIAVPLLLIWG